MHCMLHSYPFQSTYSSNFTFWFIQFQTRNVWKFVQSLQNFYYICFLQRKWCHRYMQYTKYYVQIFLVYQCFDLILSLKMLLLTLKWICKRILDLLGVHHFLVWHISWLFLYWWGMAPSFLEVFLSMLLRFCQIQKYPAH